MNWLNSEKSQAFAAVPKPDFSLMLVGERLAGARELVATLGQKLAETAVGNAPPPPNDLARIHHALHLMITLHLPQADRADGQPYITHPLAVTLTLLQQFPAAATPDMIIAALLHDTLEDQAAALAQLALPTGEMRPTDIPTLARQALTEKFGPRVAELVHHLTNPTAPPHPGIPAYEPYLAHFQAIWNADSQALVIKLADFAQNGLALSRLPAGTRKTHLQRKYGPVLHWLIGQLKSLTDPTHPLYAQRHTLCARYTAVYSRDYAPTDPTE